jgi:hypothetical protein
MFRPEAFIYEAETEGNPSTSSGTGSKFKVKYSRFQGDQLNEL